MKKAIALVMLLVMASSAIAVSDFWSVRGKTDDYKVSAWSNGISGKGHVILYEMEENHRGKIQRVEVERYKLSKVKRSFSDTWVVRPRTGPSFVTTVELDEDTLTVDGIGTFDVRRLR